MCKEKEVMGIARFLNVLTACLLRAQHVKKTRNSLPSAQGENSGPPIYCSVLYDSVCLRAGEQTILMAYVGAERAEVH